MRRTRRFAARPNIPVKVRPKTPEDMAYLFLREWHGEFTDLDEMQGSATELNEKFLEFLEFKFEEDFILQYYPAGDYHYEFDVGRPTKLAKDTMMVIRKRIREAFSAFKTILLT